MRLFVCPWCASVHDLDALLYDPECGPGKFCPIMHRPLDTASASRASLIGSPLDKTAERADLLAIAARVKSAAAIGIVPELNRGAVHVMNPLDYASHDHEESTGVTYDASPNMVRIVIAPGTDRWGHLAAINNGSGDAEMSDLGQLWIGGRKTRILSAVLDTWASLPTLNDTKRAGILMGAPYGADGYPLGATPSVTGCRLGFVAATRASGNRKFLFETWRGSGGPVKSTAFGGAYMPARDFNNPWPIKLELLYDPFARTVTARAWTEGNLEEYVETDTAYLPRFANVMDFVTTDGLWAESGSAGGISAGFTHVKVSIPDYCEHDQATLWYTP